MASFKRRLVSELLEDRRVLAQLLPDLYAWEGQSENYLHDYRIEGDLLRFSTALANQGEGPLEIRGGAALPSGNQEVYQRIFHDDGSFEEVLAGEFTYHPGHSHIHFDGYAIYNLRANDGGTPGDVVATGGKVSFCLIDITPLPGTTNGSSYGSCGATRQGISAGWSDVYGSGLSDQWINIATIPDGEYFMEIVVDPDEQLVESDETNNTTTIPVTINRGVTSSGDGYESNNSFADAFDLGTVSYFNEPGMSIHEVDDVDYFKVTSAGDGDFTVEALFTHDLGDLNVTIYDANEQFIAESATTSDLESVTFPVSEGDSFFIKVAGVNDAVNGYDLEIDGPGDIVTTTIESTDPSLPIAIRDDPAPGITSTLEGPDVELTDVNVMLTDIDHTYVGDLTVTITSPSGTTAEILRSANLNPAGFLGSGQNFSNTVIDDQASSFLGNASAPYTGSYNVNHSSIGQSPLAVFIGENALGTWTIEFEDDWGGDTGTLRDWGLQFTGIETPDGDRYELNNDFAQAIDLGSLGSANEPGLSIHTSGDTDFFRFQPTNNATATVDALFTHAEGDLELAVYDSSLTEVATSSTSNDNENISLDVTQGELYYVAVRGTGEATNLDYTLNINVPDSIAGDFDSNGIVDGDDVTHLCGVLGDGSTDGVYDLNGDGNVDSSDGEFLITDVMGLLLGDANYNGDVDVADFNLWNANKFTQGACYADGDFNFDGDVDVSDFNLWNLNKFQSAARPGTDAPVKELESSADRIKVEVDITRLAAQTVEDEDDSRQVSTTSVFDQQASFEENADKVYSQL